MALLLSPLEALDVLLYLPETLRARPLSVAAGDDLDYWAEVARWAFDLLLRRRVAPTVDGGQPRWRPVLSDPHEKDRFRRFADAMPPGSRTLAPPDGRPRSDGLFPAGAPLLRAFLEDVTDAAARDFLREILPAERRRGGPGAESAAVAAFAGPSPPELDADVLGRVKDWSLPLLEPLPEGDLRLGMRLIPPDPAQEPLAFRLRYHLESTDDPTLQITADEIWSAPEPTLRRLGRLFSHPQETLLTRLGQAAPLSPPIRRSLEDRHPLSATLSLEEAHQFLTREAPLLGEAGVSVLLPANGKLTRVQVRLHGTGREDGGTRP